MQLLLAGLLILRTRQRKILYIVFLISFYFSMNLALGQDAKPGADENSAKRFSLKYPVVLLHGASVKGAILEVGPLFLGDYWQGIPDRMRSQGIELAVPDLPTNATIAEQAIVLRNFVRRRYPNQKVNFIGHSMGGLAARFLASVLDKDKKMVASITGVATPNRGSPLANWAVRQMENKSPWYWFLRLAGYDLKYRKFLPELRPVYMEKKFNPRVPDVPGVKYYSVQAWGVAWTWSLSPLLYVPYWLNQFEDHPMANEPNDGLVPKSSQPWGELIAAVPFDHLAQINHHPFRVSMEPEVFKLYDQILERLQKDGL